MRPTARLLRTPMIRFLGKRQVPQVDHTPRPHPQSPSGSLPTSFKAYRKNAQTHGPLGGKGSQGSASAGEFNSRADLPSRYHYRTLSDIEIDNVNSGGAEVVF